MKTKKFDNGPSADPRANYIKIKHLYYLWGYFLIKYFSLKKFFNLILNLYEYKTKKVFVKSIPFKVHFDVSNVCVLNCPLCPTGQKDPAQSKKIVNFEDFKWVFDRLKNYLFFVRLYNWGEPLLCKDLFKIVDYCHANKVGVQIHSNLNYYTEEILRNIVEHKLDYISLSVDGYSQENYSFYRKNGDIGKVFHGLETIMRYKKESKSKYPILHWQYLINNKNFAEVESAREYAKKIGIDIFEAYPMSLFTTNESRYSAENYSKFLSNVKSEEGSRLFKCKKYCNFLWMGLSINPDLTFSPCCATYKDSDNFGNLFSEELKNFSDIYNSDIFQESRKLFVIKNYRPKCYTPCDKCPLYTKHR